MKRPRYSFYRWLFARRSCRRFNMALLQRSLRGLGILNYENDSLSGESYLISTLLPQHISGIAPVLFDVGANVGDYTKALAEQFPNAVIYAFEPHPRNFEQLCSNASMDRVKPCNIALGDVNGELTLYDRADYRGSAHASLHEAVISEIHRQDVVKFVVQVERLDDFTARRDISRIDLLKIDTEGNELAVLEGATRLLAEGRIGCLHFEFNEMNIVSRVFFRDFRKMLHAYKLFRLLPHGLLPLDDTPLLTELFAYQNIIALSR